MHAAHSGIVPTHTCTGRCIYLLFLLCSFLYLTDGRKPKEKRSENTYICMYSIKWRIGSNLAAVFVEYFVVHTIDHQGLFLWLWLSIRGEWMSIYVVTWIHSRIHKIWYINWFSQPIELEKQLTVATVASWPCFLYSRSPYIVTLYLGIVLTCLTVL